MFYKITNLFPHVRWLNILLFIEIILFVVFGISGITFTNVILSEWSSFIFEVVFLITVLVWINKSKIYKAAKVILILLILLPSLIPLFIQSLLLPDINAQGIDPSHKEIHWVSLAHSDLVVYATNCGATCSYGLDIEKENIFFYGLLKRSKQIANYYPGKDIQFDKVGNNQVKVVSLDIEDSGRQLSKNIPKVGDVWNLSQ